MITVRDLCKECLKKEKKKCKLCNEYWLWNFNLEVQK